MLGESLNAIGDYAFSGCRSLTNINIPSSVELLGRGAFEYCQRVTEITLGESLISIGEYAFSNCINVTGIAVPDSVESLGRGAFSYCDRLAEVTLGRALESVGDGAFYYCASLESITVNAENVYYKSLDGSLYTQDGKTLIQYAVAKPDATFRIPSEVSVIDANAFFMCASLTSIEIPVSVTAIRDSAFQRCYRLERICYAGDENSWVAIQKGNDWDLFSGDYTVVCNYTSE